MSDNSNLALRRSQSSSNVPNNQKTTKPFYQDLARDIKHFCSHACFIFLKSDRFSKFALLSIIDILQSPCVSKNPQCYKLLQNIFVDGGIFEKILKIRLTFGMGFKDVESIIHYHFEGNKFIDVEKQSSKAYILCATGLQGFMPI